MIASETDVLRKRLSDMGQRISELEAERDEAQADRPLDHPNGEALIEMNDNLHAENERLRALLAHANRWLSPFHDGDYLTPKGRDAVGGLMQSIKAELTGPSPGEGR